MSSEKIFDEQLAILEANLATLPDKPEETPESTLSALWHAAAGEPKSVQLAGENKLPKLDDAAKRKLKDFVEQRIGGMPLAHITGRQQFMGIELLAGPEALVPRKETEILGHTALKILQDKAKQQESVNVIDVCTGSGNIALAMAFYEPKVKVYAADLSKEAILLAKRNAELLGLERRVDLRDGDLLTPFDDDKFYGQIDLLTCNPPYISSGKVSVMPPEISNYEPRLAFDGGPFGIKILQRLIQEAPKFLKKGGWLVFEVGFGQGPAIMQRLGKNENYKELHSITDDVGEVRTIMARA